MQGQFEVETVTDRRRRARPVPVQRRLGPRRRPEGIPGERARRDADRTRLYRNPLQNILPGVVEGVLDVGTMIGNQLLDETRGLSIASAT